MMIYHIVMTMELYAGIQLYLMTTISAIQIIWGMKKLLIMITVTTTI